MTTSTSASPTPTFRVHGRLATLRGILIVSACLALGGTFVAQVWSGPASTTLESSVRS